MDQEKLNLQLVELVDQVTAFFGRNRTQAQARADLLKHCSEVLATVPDMGELLKQEPVYGAIGFLDKFQFVDCPEVNALSKESSADILHAIREKKALRLAESVKPVWDVLLERDPESLCSIVALCFLASKNRKVTQAFTT